MASARALLAWVVLGAGVVGCRGAAPIGAEPAPGSPLASGQASAGAAPITSPAPVASVPVGPAPSSAWQPFAPLASRWPEECPAGWEGEAALFIHPGVGLGALRLGVSRPDEVLELFGDDAKVNRHRDGRVFSISYDYQREGAYKPGRAGATVRPYNVNFSNGVVASLHFGVYQRCLQTDRGLRTSSSLRHMEAIYGKGYRLTRGDPLDTYRYESLGLEVWVDSRSREVNSFFIFTPSR